MAYRGDLDPDTADRLLTGRLDPDDAPPRYREVASLLQRRARGGRDRARSTDDALIVAMVDAIVAAGSRSSRRKHVLTRIVMTKAAAVAVVALSATGAAAATGNLPDAAQDGLARAAQHIGINLPSSANDKAREQTSTTTRTPRMRPSPRCPRPCPRRRRGRHDSGRATAADASTPHGPPAGMPGDDETTPAADRQPRVRGLRSRAECRSRGRQG